MRAVTLGLEIGKVASAAFADNHSIM